MFASTNKCFKGFQNFYDKEIDSIDLKSQCTIYDKKYTLIYNCLGCFRNALDN